MLDGIYAAALTPITQDLEPDAELAIAYYRDLLAAGCDGLNLLGTTGEAMSLSAEQRVRFMEAVACSGLPTERLICGTGAASLGDAAALTRRAHALGFAAVLVMPPFFYRDAGDDGLMRFIDALVTRVSSQPARILLYNLPRMSGVTFHAALVERIVDSYPGAILGMKDSSNDRALQRAILAAHAEFAVFPGSEAYLREAKADGAAGCISGSVCLWPRLARDVFRTADAQAARELAALRAGLAGLPLIPAVRYLVARVRKDPRWESPLPPLAPLHPEGRRRLDRYESMYSKSEDPVG